VTELAGAVKLVESGVATTLVTIPVCTTPGELGLAGIAVDPNFTTNGYVYLYRTENTGGCASAVGRSNEVVRVTMASDDTISLASLTVLLTGIRSDTGSHSAGAMRIGSDGKLWVSVGDTAFGDNQGCPGSSTNPYAQDLDALEGKILRLNLDGTAPADNPFVGQVDVREEIFAFGFRNPFRMDFDPLTDNLWVGDVGDLAFEEIDIVDAGENHGWPQCEGTFPTGCQLGGETDPAFAYSHAGSCPGEATLPTLGRSVTGGTFAGSLFGGFENHYVFGDYVSRIVYLGQPTVARDGLATTTPIITQAGGPVDFARGPDGAVYYVALLHGSIRRVTVDPALLDGEELFGPRLMIGGVINPARQRWTALSKDPTTSIGAGNGTADDPVLHGGSLEVTAPAGCGGACSFAPSLAQSPPTTEWKYIGQPGKNRGYKFKGTDVLGVTTVVRVKPGKLAMKMTGPLGFDLAVSPDPVTVRLELGGHAYCLEFGGTQKFIPGRNFKAEFASAPATCEP
jgi:glucose/arabinose dehydrogenase